MDPTQATREVFWNIEYTWLVYVLMVPTLAVFGWGFWRKIRRWRAGQPEARFDRLGERLQLFLRNAVGQGRTIKRRYAGVFHTLVYTGFIVLFLATTVVAIHHDTPLHIMKGHFYLIFQSLIVDIFGLFVLVGVALAAIRRWISKPKLLVYTDEASWILVTIFVMALTGFMIEGWRIAVTDDPWAAWSPIGNLFALGSDPWMTDAAMQRGHVIIWWFHLVVAFGWIAWVPFSKMSHVFTAPLNIFTANLDGYGGSLKTIDFETAERFGINHLGDFTWKDLLDFDACTECGRCTDVCPANTVGKSLSPRDIILDLQRLMHRQGDQSLLNGNGNGNGGGANENDGLLPIIDQETAVSPEALFACTTCAACMEACPVHIEQMPKIVDARRYLVMEEADFPEGMMDMMNSLESRQHPFAGTQFNRVDWTEGLDIDVMADMDDPHEAEVLMWVGCGGALVERNRNTVRATAKLLKKAGVKFAILGREESCTGDPARRVGNEFLFEMLAKGNVETLSTLRRAQGRHLLPSLLQLVQERVPAVRRQLRGLPPHPVPGSTAGVGPSRRARRRGWLERDFDDHLPRSLLPRPPQRRVRGAPQPAREGRRRAPGRDGAQPQHELLLRRRRRHGLRRRAARSAREPGARPGGGRHRSGCRRGGLPVLRHDARRRRERPPRRPRRQGTMQRPSFPVANARSVANLPGGR